MKNPDNVITTTNNFSEIVKNRASLNEEINSELSQLDLAISDIYHYIEFNDCHIFQIIALYGALKKLLIKRRKVKKVHQILALVKKDNNPYTKKAFLDAVCKFSELDQNAFYNIRTDILFEIFHNEELKKEKILHSTIDSESDL